MASDGSRQSIEQHLFGRGGKRESESQIASARWSDPDKLKSAAGNKDRPFYFGRDQRDPGAVFLGVINAPGDDDPRRGVPIGWRDNRHIVTVAGSRAGKRGVGVRSPNSLSVARSNPPGTAATA
jgi:hypothetical protein